MRNTFRLPEHVVKRWHGQPAATREAALEIHKAARMHGVLLIDPIAHLLWHGIKVKSKDKREGLPIVSVSFVSMCL